MTKSNVIFARYKFYNQTQGKNEPVDSFVTGVKLLARAIVDEMIRNMLLYGTHSRKVRDRFINIGADMNLQNAIDIARAHESAQSQLKKMDGGDSAQVARAQL